MDYIAYLHKEGNSDFGVSFKDFPGCITAGRTLSEAWQMAKEALALHIKGIAEDGEEIPAPSPIEDIIDDVSIKGAIAVVVPADLEETVRVNITARRSQLEKIDHLAKQAGLNRSAYIVRSATRAEDDE